LILLAAIIMLCCGSAQSEPLDFGITDEAEYDNRHAMVAEFDKAIAHAAPSEEVSRAVANNFGDRELVAHGPLNDVLTKTMQQDVSKGLRHSFKEAVSDRYSMPEDADAGNQVLSEAMDEPDMIARDLSMGPRHSFTEAVAQRHKVPEDADDAVEKHGLTDVMKEPDMIEKDLSVAKGMRLENALKALANGFGKSQAQATAVAPALPVPKLAEPSKSTTPQSMAKMALAKAHRLAMQRYGVATGTLAVPKVQQIPGAVAAVGKNAAPSSTASLPPYQKQAVQAQGMARLALAKSHGLASQRNAVVPETDEGVAARTQGYADKIQRTIEGVVHAIEPSRARANVRPSDPTARGTAQGVAAAVQGTADTIQSILKGASHPHGAQETVPAQAANVKSIAAQGMAKMELAKSHRLAMQRDAVATGRRAVPKVQQIPGAVAAAGKNAAASSTADLPPYQKQAMQAQGIARLALAKSASLAHQRQAVGSEAAGIAATDQGDVNGMEVRSAMHGEEQKRGPMGHTRVKQSSGKEVRWNKKKVDSRQTKAYAAMLHAKAAAAQLEEAPGHTLAKSLPSRQKQVDLSEQHQKKVINRAVALFKKRLYLKRIIKRSVALFKKRLYLKKQLMQAGDKAEAQTSKMTETTVVMSGANATANATAPHLTKAQRRAQKRHEKHQKQRARIAAKMKKLKQMIHRDVSSPLRRLVDQAGVNAVPLHRKHAKPSPSVSSPLQAAIIRQAGDNVTLAGGVNTAQQVAVPTAKSAQQAQPSHLAVAGGLPANPSKAAPLPAQLPAIKTKITKGKATPAQLSAIKTRVIKDMPLKAASTPKEAKPATTLQAKATQSQVTTQKNTIPKKKLSWWQSPSGLRRQWGNPAAWAQAGVQFPGFAPHTSASPTKATPAQLSAIKTKIEKGKTRIAKGKTKIAKSKTKIAKGKATPAQLPAIKTKIEKGKATAAQLSAITKSATTEKDRHRILGALATEQTWSLKVDSSAPVAPVTGAAKAQMKRFQAVVNSYHRKKTAARMRALLEQRKRLFKKKLELKRQHLMEAPKAQTAKEQEEAHMRALLEQRKRLFKKKLELKRQHLMEAQGQFQAAKKQPQD